MRRFPPPFIPAIAVLIAFSIFIYRHLQDRQETLPPFTYVAEKPVSTKTSPLPEKRPAPQDDAVKEPPPPVPEKKPGPVAKEAAAPPAQDAIDPKQIVKAADDLMRGETIQGIYMMMINTPSWERTLKLRVYSQGRDKMFIRILSPPKEAGIGTLRIDSEMWNYLPDIEKTLKIPPSMMLQPWMGSDFANDDLVKESSIVHDYDHRLLSMTSVGGDIAYKIELTPKSSSAVVWGKRVQWIRMDDHVPLKEEYYDEKGGLIKVLSYSDIGRVSDRTIPRRWTMTSKIKPNHETVIELKDVEYNRPLQNHIFTLQNLKKIQ